MATFYLLPPRDCLEEVFTSVFGSLLPGLPMPADGWDLLLVHLAANSGWSRDLYIVTRDEIPEGEPLEDSLRVHFGAEPGDRVVEVPLPRFTKDRPTALRSWIVKPVGVSNSSDSFYNQLLPGSLSARRTDVA